MKITKKHLLSIIILTVIFSAQFILVFNNTANADSLLDTVKEGGLEKIGSGAYDTAGEPTDIRQTIVNIIKVFLTFLGLIFVVLILFAGYTWMTSQGNDDKINEAKSRMKTAIIGLIIIIASYSITVFMFDDVRKAITEEVW